MTHTRWITRMAGMAGVALAAVLLFGLSGCDDDDARQARALGTVPASTWVTNTTEIRSYRVDSATSNNVSLTLLDASKQPLATMSLRNLPGHLNADGSKDAMQAVLETAGAPALKLLTHGLRQDNGYITEMLLESGTHTARLRAENRYAACYTDLKTSAQQANPTAPDCALPLSLDDPHDYTLPSCGLPSYQAAGVATQLSRLTYIQKVDTSASSISLASGAQAFNDAGEVVEAQLDVLRDGEVTAAADVQAWLQQTGADAIIGSLSETLLTAAFQDAAWRRFVEQKLTEQSHPVALFSTSCGSGAGARPAAAGCDNFTWSKLGDITASANGDPHFTVFASGGKQQRYDFMGRGEYVVAKGSDYEIQARLQPLAYSQSTALTQACAAHVSWIRAVALQLKGTKVGIYAQQTPHLTVNGNPVADASALAQQLPAGVQLVHDPSSSRFRFVLDSGVQVLVDRFSTSMRLSMQAPAAAVAQLKGLFKAFEMADGTTLAAPLNFTQLYSQFGESWRVKAAADSLFSYPAGKTLADFYDAAFPPRPLSLADLVAAAQADGTSRSRVEAAQQTCADVEGESQRSWCVMDTACRISADPREDDYFAKLYRDLPASGAMMTVADRAVQVSSALAATQPEQLEAVHAAKSCRLPAPPADVVFPEQRGLVLTAPVAVDVVGSGGATIPAGTTVDVFFVHLPKPDPARVLPTVASLRFSGKVLGIATTPANLAATDALGDPALSYAGSDPGRGFEPGDGDALSLSADKHALTLRSAAPGDRDELRVFVAAPAATAP